MFWHLYSEEESLKSVFELNVDSASEVRDEGEEGGVGRLGEKGVNRPESDEHGWEVLVDGVKGGRREVNVIHGEAVEDVGKEGGVDLRPEYLQLVLFYVFEYGWE